MRQVKFFENLTMLSISSKDDTSRSNHKRKDEVDFLLADLSLDSKILIELGANNTFLEDLFILGRISSKE